MKYLVGVRGSKKDIDQLVELLRSHDTSYQRIDLGMGGEISTEFWSHGRSSKAVTGGEKYQGKLEELELYPLSRGFGCASASILTALSTIVASIETATLSAIVLGVTKETIRDILNWLKEKRMKDCKLEIVLRGNVLKLSEDNLEILRGIIEKEQEIRRRGKKSKKHPN